MACPICFADCVCKGRKDDGTCCSCHRHQNQKGFTRVQVDGWRAAHGYSSITDQEWKRLFRKHAPPFVSAGQP